MGRKSNRKRHGRAIRERYSFATDDKRQGYLAFGMMAMGVGFFIWGGLLSEDTFIPATTLWLTALAGTLIAIIILSWAWRSIRWEWGVGWYITMVLFYGIMAGAPVPFFAINAINYYFKSDRTEQVTLEIIETGHLTKRGGGLGRPYAVVELDDISDNVYFPGTYKRTIAQYKQVTLTLSKGALGYYVIVDKQLKN